jgi:hypothetical protein
MIMGYQNEDKRLVIDYLNARGGSWFEHSTLTYKDLDVPFPIWDAVAMQHLWAAIEWKRERDLLDVPNNHNSASLEASGYPRF